MTITTEQLGSDTYDDLLYEDTSGGFLEFAISHPSYTSQHRVRVIPFGASSSGVFNSPPTGTTANIENEAENIAALIKPLYFTDTSLAFTSVHQVLADNTGTQPYPYSFGGATAWSAGTGSGASNNPSVVLNIVGHGTDGSRWMLTLPGLATSEVTATPQRTVQASWGTNIKALMDYLTGQTNGGVHAQKTNVVSHSGAPIAAPVYGIVMDNKRIRRRLRLV